MCRTVFLLLLQLLLSSVHAEEQAVAVSDEKFSTWLWDYLTVGASLTAGIGGRSVAIDVEKHGTDNHGKIIENKDNEFFYSTVPKPVILVIQILVMHGC